MGWYWVISTPRRSRPATSHRAMSFPRPLGVVHISQLFATRTNTLACEVRVGRTAGHSFRDHVVRSAELLLDRCMRMAKQLPSASTKPGRPHLVSRLSQGKQPSPRQYPLTSAVVAPPVFPAKRILQQKGKVFRTQTPQDSTLLPEDYFSAGKSLEEEALGLAGIRPGASALQRRPSASRGRREDELRLL